VIEIVDAGNITIERVKKRKKEMRGRRSHSSPRRHRHVSGSSSPPLPETIFDASSRFSEFVHGNLDGSSRETFKTANVSSLTNSEIVLANRSFLIAKIIREETMNGISSFEFKKMKKELVESKKSLESSLEANLSLNTQIK